MGKLTQQAIANVPAELRLQVLENTSTALKALAFSETLATIMVQKGIITGQEFDKTYAEIIAEEEYKEYLDVAEEGIKALKKQVEINQIVEKILTEGMESLTEEERKIYEGMDDDRGKGWVDTLSNLSRLFTGNF